MQRCASNHPLTHSLTHSPTYSLPTPYLLTHSLTRPFTRTRSAVADVLPSSLPAPLRRTTLCMQRGMQTRRCLDIHGVTHARPFQVPSPPSRKTRPPSLFLPFITSPPSPPPSSRALQTCVARDLDSCVLSILASGCSRRSGERPRTWST
jgi:hypothetical protein